MRLPLHTNSEPIVGEEARRVLNAVKAGRGVLAMSCRVALIFIAIPAVVATGAETPWQIFESPSGDFSISAPVQLIDKSRTVRHAIGTVQRNYYSAVAFDTSFSVERSDFAVGGLSSQSELQILNGARDSLVASLKERKARLLTESPVSLNGRFGREVKIDLHEGTVVMVSRIYVSGDYLYSATVATSPENIGHPSIVRFFDSFRLSAPKAP